MSIEKSVRPGLIEAALDPQTSGGLLIAVTKSHAEELVAALHAAGVSNAVQVGSVTARQAVSVRLV
jgi:selenide,water dikinase